MQIVKMTTDFKMKQVSMIQSLKEHKVNTEIVNNFDDSIINQSTFDNLFEDENGQIVLETLTNHLENQHESISDNLTLLKQARSESPIMEVDDTLLGMVHDIHDLFSTHFAKQKQSKSQITLMHKSG